MRELEERHPGVRLSSLPHFRPDNAREIEFGVYGKAEPAKAMYSELKHKLEERNYEFTENHPD